MYDNMTLFIPSNSRSSLKKTKTNASRLPWMLSSPSEYKRKSASKFVHKEVKSWQLCILPGTQSLLLEEANILTSEKFDNFSHDGLIPEISR